MQVTIGSLSRDSFSQANFIKHFNLRHSLLRNTRLISSWKKDFKIHLFPSFELILSMNSVKNFDECFQKIVA